MDERECGADNIYCYCYAYVVWWVTVCYIRCCILGVFIRCIWDIMFGFVMRLVTWSYYDDMCMMYIRWFVWCYLGYYSGYCLGCFFLDVIQDSRWILWSVLLGIYIICGIMVGMFGQKDIDEDEFLLWWYYSRLIFIIGIYFLSRLIFYYWDIFWWFVHISEVRLQAMDIIEKVVYIPFLYCDSIMADII